MDSFTILFQAELKMPDVMRELQDAGLNAHSQAPSGTVVSMGDACVWIKPFKIGDLDASDFEDEREWPIQPDRVGTLFDVSVRRNVEQEDLAFRIANQLVRTFEGAIMWDGMDNWEKRYAAYLLGNPENRGTPDQ